MEKDLAGWMEMQTVLDVMAHLTENNLAEWMEMQKASMRETYLVLLSDEMMASKKACLLDLLKAKK